MNDNPLAFVDHEHAGCIERGLADAEALCAARSLRLTDARRRVLEILLQEHRAIGAYEVLNRLSTSGENAHPPAAYRALDFLVAHGLAHKIERLNAFVACTRPREGHAPAFLICRDCRGVAETDVSFDMSPFDSAAEDVGFSVERTSIEVEGLCRSCQPATT
ncbi:MAG: Fur family transcriptional regulator [Pseudomonadota bacterium]